MTTGELTALNRRNGDNFLELTSFQWPPQMGRNDWLVWLFHNEARMIGREWRRAWAHRARRLDDIDMGEHR